MWLCPLAESSNLDGIAVCQTINALLIKETRLFNPNVAKCFIFRFLLNERMEIRKTASENINKFSQSECNSERTEQCLK